MGKIAVIGDVMLDLYQYKTPRENPERRGDAYFIDKIEMKAGGAGNVAVNLAKLGSNVILVGVTGADTNSERLRRVLDCFGIKGHLISDPNRYTTVVIRNLLSDGTPLGRDNLEGGLVIEDNGLTERAVRGAYIGSNHVDEFLDAVRNCDRIVIADYKKGAISENLVKRLKQLGVPILADTKKEHLRFYNDVFLLKPNAKEAREMSGLEDEIEAAKKIRKELGTQVLLTRGSEGVSYFGLDNERFDLPAIPSGNIDVTGAGDVVMATLAHFLNKGSDIHEAIKLANVAGGISVNYVGCYSVSEEEIFAKKRELGI